MKNKNNKIMRIGSLPITNNFLILLVILSFLIIGCKKETNNLVETWKVGASTGILKDYSQEELNNLKKNGIKYIEIGARVTVGRTADEIENWVKKFKKRINEAGIKVWSLHLPFSNVIDISTENINDRSDTVQKHKKIMKLFHSLNIKKYVIHPSAEPIKDVDRLDRIKNSIASLKILSKEAEKYDAQLAVENLPRTCLGNTSNEILKMVNAVGNGIGICFDSNHTLNESPEKFIKKIDDLIVTVHISDYNGIDEKHWMPGNDGIIKWDRVIKGLAATGYDGPWLYEVGRGGGRGRNDNLSPKNLTQNWQKLKKNYQNNLTIQGK